MLREQSVSVTSPFLLTGYIFPFLPFDLVTPSCEVHGRGPASQLPHTVTVGSLMWSQLCAASVLSFLRTLEGFWEFFFLLPVLD